MMIINRVWEMPNKNTFDIRCVKKIIDKYNNIDNNPEYLSIDPFANKNKIAKVTNDLDPEFDTTHHLDANDFLKLFEPNSVDLVLFDAPYSPRQVSESYKKFGMTVNMETTQSSYWSKLKDQISLIIKPGGYCITCAWNSAGIGKTKGFEIIEILLCPHGGAHNDTIITVDKKL